MPDPTEHTDGGTVIGSQTRVPLGTAVAVAVAVIGWALSLSATYYSLVQRIETVRTETIAHGDEANMLQERQIIALESDQRIIKHATCALARKQNLIISGCP